MNHRQITNNYPLEYVYISNNGHLCYLETTGKVSLLLEIKTYILVFLLNISMHYIFCINNILT